MAKKHPENKYDLVLYDLDGTLQDSVPLIVESFHKAYERVFGRCDRTDADLMTYIGRPLMQTFEMHDSDTARKLFDAYIDYNETEMRKGVIRLFPGVMDELACLNRAGVMQSVVTSKRREAAKITIDLLDIGQFFDTAIYREDCELAKPHGEPLVAAASRLGISDMSRVLYVGDAVADILSAHDCGADMAAVSWTRMPRADLDRQSPEYFISDMKELSCIIGAGEL